MVSGGVMPALPLHAEHPMQVRPGQPHISAVARLAGLQAMPQVRLALTGSDAT